MATIHLRAGPGFWTDRGKQDIAVAMIRRGEHFLGAAALLKKQGGNGYVWRHLTCQAAELMMKGVLLLRDYDRFQPSLKRFGHRLVTLADACTSEFKLPPVAGNLRLQLAAASDLYEHHELRYASGIDLLVDPETIKVDLILRRLLAMSIVTHRALARTASHP